MESSSLFPVELLQAVVRKTVSRYGTRSASWINYLGLLSPHHSFLYVCEPWGPNLVLGDEKEIIVPPQVPEKQFTHPSDLVHGEETARWPFMVISSLFLLIGPGSLSFLKIASDTICTSWSCEGTWWSFSDSEWPFWESGMFSGALMHASGPSECPGRRSLFSTGWAASGSAHLICTPSLFFQCLLLWLSSLASSPSTCGAARRSGLRGLCAFARCFRRGRYLLRAKAQRDIHITSVLLMPPQVPEAKVLQVSEL